VLDGFGHTALDPLQQELSVESCSIEGTRAENVAHSGNVRRLLGVFGRAVVGRWPLGSEEFSESGVEFGWGWRILLSVGFVEGELVVGVAFDPPTVFV
jgi:hypothetical protein